MGEKREKSQGWYLHKGPMITHLPIALSLKLLGPATVGDWMDFRFESL